MTVLIVPNLVILGVSIITTVLFFALGIPIERTTLLGLTMMVIIVLTSITKQYLEAPQRSPQRQSTQ